MASLVRFYKQKCDERNALIARLKGEVTENKMLKKSSPTVELSLQKLTYLTERYKLFDRKLINFANVLVSLLGMAT
jgi:hypothetical protein